MQLHTMKAALATAWVAAVSLVGIAANVRSTASWVVLACVALLPPVAMAFLWNAPRQTMSESIREVLR